MERHTIRYVGSPELASLFVRMLETEGASVKWDPPLERQDLPEMAETVVTTLIVLGTEAAVRAAVTKFRERWPKAVIDWREEDGHG
jgi:hypothetical protein